MKNYMYIVVGSVRFGWVACHVDDAPWPFGPFVRSPGDIEISLHYSRQALTVTAKFTCKFVNIYFRAARA